MNAAQLASRKIKSAKGVRAKLGNRTLPSAGTFGVNGTQSFQGQDASSSGGLFGGGLNASGTFNFSAPVQGISFGNNSETSTPFWGSDAEEDRRADPTAEEAERRNKPFRMVDGSTGASPQPFSSTFQRTPLSALGQPNGLGSVPEAAKPNPFQVSRSQSPAVAPPFNFGATSTQEQQPASNIFSFGQNSQAAPANNSFRFGTPPAVQEKPAGSIFSFNQPSSQAQPVSTGVSFSSTTTTTTDKPASGIFSFGQTSAHPQQPSSSSISFDPPPAPLNIFGNSNASNSTPTPNLFGQSNQQSTSSSNVFSNLNPRTTTTNDIFGNQNQQSATPAKSLFADTAPKSTPTNSFFGGSNQQSAPTSTIFGNLNQASTSSSSLFGTPKPQPTPLSNLFGVQKEQPAPTSNQFGVPKEQSAPASNLFGAQQDGSAPTGNLFGAQKEQTAPTNNLFSSQQQQTTPAGNLFGGAKPSGNPFGGQSGTSSGIFANKPSTLTSSIFGNQAPKSNTPTNFFANLNKPTTQVNIELSNPTTNDTSQNANGESGASIAAGPISSFSYSLQNGDNTNKPPPSPKPASATFQSTSSAFGSANEPEADSVLPSIEVEGPLMDNDVLSRLENGTPTQPSTSNLFSSMKPIEAPKAPTNASTNANVARSSSSPSKSSSNRAAAPVNATSFTKDNELARLQNYYSEMGEVPDSVIEEKCPKHFTDAQKIQFFAAYRLRSLNKGIKQYIDGAELGADFSPAFHHYIERREEILEACATGLNNLKRKHDEVQDEVENQE